MGKEKITCAWIAQQDKSQSFLPEIGALPDGRFDRGLDFQYLSFDLF